METMVPQGRPDAHNLGLERGFSPERLSALNLSQAWWITPAKEGSRVGYVVECREGICPMPGAEGKCSINVGSNVILPQDSSFGEGRCFGMT